MTAKAGWVTVMLHVASVEASIKFYELIGFKVIDVEGHGPLSWARLHCEDGSAIMLLRAEHDDRVGPLIEPEKQGIMLILYTADLPKLRAPACQQCASSGDRISGLHAERFAVSSRPGRILRWSEPLVRSRA